MTFIKELPMKKSGLLLLSLLAFAGCGDINKKNPVGDDLKTIREQGKNPDEVIPQSPTVAAHKSSTTEAAPSDLKISDLPTEVTEGQEPISFTVTATVPGVDKTGIKPNISVTYDGVKITEKNKFQELNGARYIFSDPSKKEPEFLGNFQWKFSLLIDVKNPSIQPQLAKDGSLMTKATGTRVRATFKVSNSQGASTPATLAQILIRYKRGN